MNWDRIFIHAGFLLLLSSGGFYLHYLMRGGNRAERAGLALFLVGTLAGFFALVLRYLDYRSLYPGANVIGPCEMFLFLSFSVALFTLLGLIVTKIRLLPLVSAPVGALCAILAVFTLGIRAAPREDLKDSFPIGHIGAGILSYSALFLLLVVSIIYLIVEKELKRKHLRSQIERVPSLGDLGKAQTLFLSLGFFFLTFVIASGIVGALKTKQPMDRPDPKVFLAGLTWLVYGAILAARLTSRLRGRRMAGVTIWAGLLIVATFLSELVWEGWHDYLHGQSQSERSTVEDPAPSPPKSR